MKRATESNRKSVATESYCIHRALLCFFLLSFATIFPLLSYADFEDIGAGARALGMGNAFVGLADDSRAIVYNPAGLAYLRRSEFTADYARLFLGLDDKSDLSHAFLSYIQPIAKRKSLDERVRDLRRLTAMESQVDVSTTASIPAPAIKKDITFLKDWGTIGMAFSNFALSGTLSENVLWLSYGRKIIERLSAGFSTKILYQSYIHDAYTRKDPVFDSGKRDGISSFSFDAGLLYNFYPRLFWGLSVSNLNKPNVALNPIETEALPMSIKNGLALRDKKVRAVLDFIYEEKTYRIHAGAERWFKSRTFALRAGGGIGSREVKNITFGMSANLDKVQIDYAFLYPISGVSETVGNHRISLVYRFGRAPLEDLETGSIELYYAKLQAEAEMLRARLEKAEDERYRLEKVLVEEALTRIKERVRTEKLEAAITPAGKKDSTSGKALSTLTGISSAVSGMKTYVTSKGDNLQAVAELFYGKKDRWMEIFNLNRDKVGRGGSLKPGTVLLIPGVVGTARSTEEMVAPQTRSLTPLKLEPQGKSSEASTAPPQDLAPLPEGTTLSPVKPKDEEKKKAATKVESPPRPKSYTVLPGDTLNSIAQKVYGDPKRWKEIYNANKDNVERGSVSPGQILTIP